MRAPDAWAIRHVTDGWLIDTCAGGHWTGPEKYDAPHVEVYELATTFPTGTQAFEALDAADIPREGCEAVLVSP